MKKIVFQLLTLTLLLVIGCDKTEDHIPPTIELIKEGGYIWGDTSLAGGDDINIKVKLQKGDLNITNFLIDVYANSESRYLDTGMNTDYLVWSGTFLKTLSPVEDWKLMAFDRDGNATAIGFTISLDATPEYDPLLSYPALVFGAQDNEGTGGCYNSSDDIICNHQEAAADTNLQKGIDILYFYDETDKNTIASPGANIPDGIFTINPSSWTYINTTRYYKTSLTPDDFDAGENDSILFANYDEGEAKRKAKSLKINDIYTFKTQAGRLGIFMVNAVEGTSEGNISISLKIQQ